MKRIILILLCVMSFQVKADVKTLTCILPTAYVTGESLLRLTITSNLYCKPMNTMLKPKFMGSNEDECRFQIKSPGHYSCYITASILNGLFESYPSNEISFEVCINPICVVTNNTIKPNPPSNVTIIYK